MHIYKCTCAQKEARASDGRADNRKMETEQNDDREKEEGRRERLQKGRVTHQFSHDLLISERLSGR